MPFRQLSLEVGDRPVYLECETTLLVDADVQLKSSMYTSTMPGQAYLTTHRLLWVSRDSPKTALALNLRNVREVTHSSKGTFKRKFFLHITVLSNKQTASGNGEGSAASSNPTSAPAEVVLLIMRNQQGSKEWLTKTQMAVVKAAAAFRRASEAENLQRTAAHSANDTTPNVAARSIGIAGRRLARSSVVQAQKSLTATAFENIQTLKLRAKEIVTMIDNFANNPRNKQVSRSESGGGTSSEEAQQFQSLLQTVGIANPVLRGAFAGKGSKVLKAFEQELSLELAKVCVLFLFLFSFWGCCFFGCGDAFPCVCVCAENTIQI